LMSRPRAPLDTLENYGVFNLRHGLNASLGFAPEDRAERARNQTIALRAGAEFVEMFVDAPCEPR
jgi:adenylylsulfate kinase-like enzyme